VKNNAGRPRQVFGGKNHRVGVETLAHVIERHDCHDETADGVNAGVPRSRVRHPAVGPRPPPAIHHNFRVAADGELRHYCARHEQPGVHLCIGLERSRDADAAER
jgi:hypothetical protein